MTGAVLTGSFTIIAFSFGLYGWTTVVAAAVAGFLASWPAAYLISRRIKRLDPGWDEAKRRKAGIMPKPADPEV